MVNTFIFLRFNYIKSIVLLLIFTIGHSLCDDESVTKLFQKLDLVDLNNNSHKITLNVTIVPGLLRNEFTVHSIDPGNGVKSPFYVKANASVWLSDEEYDNVNDLSANNLYGQYFKIFREKLFRRFLFHGYPQEDLKYKYLTVLLCSTMQGSVIVTRNNLFDHLNASIDVFVEYPTSHTKSQDWDNLKSNLPDLSLDVIHDTSPAVNENRVDVGFTCNRVYYDNVVFEHFEEENKKRTVEDEGNEGADKSEGERRNSVDNMESSTSEDVKGDDASILKGEDALESAGDVHEPPGVQDESKGGDQSTSQEAKAVQDVSGVESGNDAVGDETNSESSDVKLADDQPQQTSTNQPSSSTEHVSSDEQPHTYSQEPSSTPEQSGEEYDERKLLDKFELVDSDGAGVDGLTPLTIEITTGLFTHSDKKIVNTEMRTVLHLQNDVLDKCKQDELTSECAEEIRNRLLDRYEDDGAKPFKWGRLVSILMGTSLQGDVYVNEYKLQKGEPSVLNVTITASLVTSQLMNQLKELDGDVTSFSGKTRLSFKLLDSKPYVTSNRKPIKCGVTVSASLFLRKFLAIYGNFDITHTAADANFAKPKEQEKKTEEPQDDTSHEHEDNNNTTSTLDELIDQHSDTSNLNHNIHLILSGYERALLDVPKSLSGYKLSWSTVEGHPNLQQLWKKALDMMNLLSRDGNLKDFLDTHTFTYSELRNLFDITYGLIASDNYEAAREFYESVGITQKDVDTNLSKVKNLFFAKTSTSITRLPPIIKEMNESCPVKSMILSLSAHDLVERLQLMFGLWLSEFPENEDGDNFELAVLCSGSAVVLQQQAFFQLDQGFHESNTPWIDLITSFSRLARGNYNDKGRKEQLKSLVNGFIGKKCRKYINGAGIVSTTPYKGAGRDYLPKSLLGSVGNALDQNMEAPVDEIVVSMSNYFTEALKHNRIGNAIGICLSLQVLNIMHTCFSIEHSSDYLLYMLGLLTFDTKSILEAYQNYAGNVEVSGKLAKEIEYINSSCQVNNSVVENVLTKLLSLLSIDSHHVLIEELKRRQYVEPEVSDNGQFTQDHTKSSTSSESDNDSVLNFDDYVELQDANNSKDFESFLELSSELDHHSSKFNVLHDNLSADEFNISVYPHNTYDPHVLHEPHPDPKNLYGLSYKNTIGLPDMQFLDGIYKKLLNGSGIIDPRDISTLTFDIRLDRLGKGGLVSLPVPLSFHKKEVEFLKGLKGKEILHLLLYRLNKRVDEFKKQLPRFEDNWNKDHNDDHHHKSIAVPEHVLHLNNDVMIYKSLNSILSSLPLDGFYFEKVNGEHIPNNTIGLYTCNLLGTKQPTIILQIIDPIHEAGINKLQVDNHHIKKHDQTFYQNISI